MVTVLLFMLYFLNFFLQVSQLGYCTAIHDYIDPPGGDLEFVSGDVIEITEIISDDWLSGRLNGLEGSFPRTFVSMNNDEVPTSGNAQAAVLGL